MGDSIALKCNSCKSKFPKGKFPFLFIGRGIEDTYISLPAYCSNCETFDTPCAINTYCPHCSVQPQQLLGDFVIVANKHLNKHLDSFNFVYSWDILNYDHLKLTEEFLIKSSHLSFIDRLIIKYTKDWKRNFSIVFKIGFNKYYHCPNCSSYAVKLSPAFAMWD